MGNVWMRVSDCRRLESKSADARSCSWAFPNRFLLVDTVDLLINKKVLKNRSQKGIIKRRFCSFLDLRRRLVWSTFKARGSSQIYNWDQAGTCVGSCNGLIELFKYLLTEHKKPSRPVSQNEILALMSSMLVAGGVLILIVIRDNISLSLSVKNWLKEKKKSWTQFLVPCLKAEQYWGYKGCESIQCWWRSWILDLNRWRKRLL